MKGYQSKNWQEFRREVIELDGGRCRLCGRQEPEVVLQVHHKQYLPDRLPWQYAYNDCETLCKGCHAAEHSKIPPKFGWRYLGYEDLGEVSSNCELCGSNFRYQFFVYHQDWGSMQVGAYCCNALTGTEMASMQMDKQTRLDERRLRFVNSKRWIEISARSIIRQQGIRVEIAKLEDYYHIQLNQFQGRESFDTLPAAKSHVFDIIEDGRASKFLKRRGDIHDARSNRQTIRLKDYDYSKSGLYFITICSFQQKCIFGHGIESEVRLNSLGKLVSAQWKSLVKHYSGIQLHDYVVMPNHFHGVIEILDDAGAMNLAPTVGDLVRGFKARSTREVRFKKLVSGKLWQRNYYEHIIRDENSFVQILEYIENNPAKWCEDAYFVDL